MTDKTQNGLERRLLFREVNERICELSGLFGSADETSELVCECDRDDCHEYVVVPIAEFESVRRAERRFVVARGHESPDADVERSGRRYSVVEVASEPALAQLSTVRARHQPPAFGGAAA